MRLLVTRPASGDRALERGLEAAGHELTIAPLMRIVNEPVELELSGVQALIATSRNGLEALSRHPVLATAVGLQVFAVGPATAKLAHEMGFASVHQGSGTAAELAKLIAQLARPERGTLLHLTGDHSAFDLGPPLEQAGFRVRRAVVYRAEAVRALPPDVQALLRGDKLGGVILMSPRTATIFCHLVNAADLGNHARRLTHFCLSNAVANGLAELAPDRVAVAIRPNSQEMLALLSRTATQSGS